MKKKGSLRCPFVATKCVASEYPALLRLLRLVAARLGVAAAALLILRALVHRALLLAVLVLRARLARGLRRRRARLAARLRRGGAAAAGAARLAGVVSPLFSSSLAPG